ncbi:MAG: hypothetical protein NC215_00365 [Ruminococcus sp.]|nr:hypothetical protein [Ruminococcus sp.]
MKIPHVHLDDTELDILDLLADTTGKSKADILGEGIEAMRCKYMPNGASFKKPNKLVTFNMMWTMSGLQQWLVPVKICNQGDEAIKEYLLERWDEIPLPAEGKYVNYSDELDVEYGFEFRKDEK